MIVLAPPFHHCDAGIDVDVLYGVRDVQGLIGGMTSVTCSMVRAEPFYGLAFYL